MLLTISGHLPLFCEAKFEIKIKHFHIFMNSFNFYNVIFVFTHSHIPSLKFSFLFIFGTAVWFGWLVEIVVKYELLIFFLLNTRWQ